MGNSCLPGCRWWCLLLRHLCCPFFPLDVLDGIWDFIESVSGDSYLLLPVANLGVFYSVAHTNYTPQTLFWGILFLRCSSVRLSIRISSVSFANLCRTFLSYRKTENL